MCYPWIEIFVILDSKLKLEWIYTMLRSSPIAFAIEMKSKYHEFIWEQNLIQQCEFK